MKQELEHLVATAPAWAARRAQYALEITATYESGELTESEYQELMRDLVHADQFNEEADNLEIKNYLVTAVMIGARLV
jgi:hypothetical protein